MYRTRDVGGLAIVEETVTKRQVDAELRKLAPPGGYPIVFVELQLDVMEKPVWCICVQVAGDQEPLTVSEWRDDRGEAIELTMGVVEKVKQLEGAGFSLMETLKRKAAERKAYMDAEQRRRYRETADDLLPLIQGKRSHPVHRSVGLRMARDKQRARGEKV